MNYIEAMNAKIAADIVAAFGGFMSFDQYDACMWHVRYMIPISWYGREQKANNDKLCAFAAVRDGLLQQTDIGYRLTASPPSPETPSQTPAE